MIESSNHVAGWRERITLFAPQTQKRMNGAVNVNLDFSFARAKGHFGTGRNVGQLNKSAPEHKESKPDVDKLCRGILDAINNGGFV